MESIRLPARLESVKGARSFIKNKMSMLNLHPRLVARVELALEEVLVNICRYAYPTQKGDFEVHCRLADADRLCLEIHDWGIPFNPLEGKRPDPFQNLSSRRVGGWGVELMRHMVDDLKYSFFEGKNTLSLTFLTGKRDLPEPRI